MSAADASVKAVRWQDGELYLLDQTLLPDKIVVERQTSATQVRESIRQLKVRGAPAIGIAGAYGLVLALRDKVHLDQEHFIKEMRQQADYLEAARPTGVNLRWALRRMVQRGLALTGADPQDIHAELLAEAMRIDAEDRRLCRSIGEAGKPLIKPGMGILTHCNAGWLATSEWGTATAPMYLAHRDGVDFRVYADETRPLLQGARLTAWELLQAGIDVTLICDNMAATMMAQGNIDLVITGADRVAANGDAANKIGTLGVAILARHFHIPFYVAIPYSTIDPDAASGEDIPIEERTPQEVTCWGNHRTAPEAVKVRNPAFDVTPNDLITGIITERGILRSPYNESLRLHYPAGATS
ncbi:MAG: S-methyl-5-thioribose-1-phosphate isomerase [Gammaproteobacteria bacterium]|nr:S-methyl-5-thioribose-1-phosphate isomerase [Gammaproteobacteria bacterium]